jgi:hypothetical protein
MNPSYCRIRVPRDVALARFAAWQRLSHVGPLAATSRGEALRLACDENGRWRGHAVLASEVGGWTLFEDLSGILGGISAESWQEFVLVQDGRVVREFLDEPDDPNGNVDRGGNDATGEPFLSWIDVAGFVDEDELGYSEAGLLLVWPA